MSLMCLSDVSVSYADVGSYFSRAQCHTSYTKLFVLFRLRFMYIQYSTLRTFGLQCALLENALTVKTLKVIGPLSIFYGTL